MATPPPARQRPWRAAVASARARLGWEVRKAWAGVWLWVCATALLLGADRLGGLDGLRAALGDQHARLQSPADAASPLLVVELGPADLARHGALPWPWATWELLLAPLDTAGVEALVPTTPAVELFPAEAPPPGSRAAAWVERGHLVLPVAARRVGGRWRLDDGPRWAPRPGPALRFQPDADGRVRRLPLDAPGPDGPVPTVAAALLDRVGAPTDDPDVPIRFWGDDHPLPVLEAHRILGGEVDGASLAVSVVVLGRAPAVGEGLLTPAHGPDTPAGAAEVLARAALSHLSSAAPVPVGGLGWAVALGLAPALWLWRRQALVVALVTPALAAAVVGVAHVALNRGFVLPEAEAVAFLLVVGALVLLVRARQVRGLLARLQASALEAEAEIAPPGSGPLPELLSSFHRTVAPFHPVESLLLAVLRPGDRWLQVVAGVGAGEEDIAERRRDPSRAPWATALEEIATDAQTGFMRAPDLASHLVPLRYVGELRGFLVLNLRPGARGDAVRWARMLAPEIGLQVDATLAAERSLAREVPAEQALREIDAQLRALLAQRASYRESLDALPTGLLLASRLGEVQLINRRLSELLEAGGHRATAVSLAEITHTLSGQRPEVMAPRFEALVQRGIPFSFSFPSPEGDGQSLEATARGVWSTAAEASAGPPEALLLAVTTQGSSEARERARLIGQRIQEELSVVQGFAGILRLSQDLDAEGREWIHTLEGRLERLTDVVAALDPRTESDDTRADRGPVDLVELLRDVKQGLRRPLTDRITIKSPAMGVSPVVADRERSRRGLQLLLEEMVDRDGQDDVPVVLEEGEGPFQQIRISPPLHGLSGAAAARLFAPIEEGEVEGLGGDPAEGQASALIRLAGGTLTTTRDDRSKWCLLVEFPKL